MTDLPAPPAEETDGMLQAVPGSEVWLHAHYHLAYIPAPAESPPYESRCADCGDTSADAGRYRPAETYEAADEDGEIYECSTCGGIMVIDSQNATTQTPT